MEQMDARTPAWRTWIGRLSAAWLGLALAVTSASAQFNKAKVIPFWDESNESSSEAIDHGAWQQLLDKYLRVPDEGVSLFDYRALNGNSGDRRELGRYLDRLEGLDPREYRRDEQKAYWINLYNALTVKVVTDNFPVESIRDIRSKNWLAGLVFPGPWDDKYLRIAGQDLTLNNIENGILRPIWNDSRIHYGVNCASHGCPSLAASAFTADNTDALLEAGARAYINDPRGVDLVDEDFIVISSIYDWFKEDFGGNDEGVFEHLLKYAEGDLKEALKDFGGAVDYEYDWSLNAP